MITLNKTVSYHMTLNNMKNNIVSYDTISDQIIQYHFNRLNFI